MSSFGSWIGYIVNQLRAHSHIGINPKITKIFERNFSMWHNIENLNTRNNQETIQTTVKGVKMNCSQPNYGCIRH
jgi:hypothetical protein